MSVVPKSSINALFPEAIECGFGVKVYPLTLAHYALLEKINSYLIGGNSNPDSIEVVKTFYICTHPSKEVMADFDNLESNAFEWAETLPPMMHSIISEAILKQIDIMSKVSPVVDGDDGKKKLVTGT